MTSEQLIQILLSKMSENDRATRSEMKGLEGITKEDAIRALVKHKTQKAALAHFGKPNYSQSYLTKFLETTPGWEGQLMKHTGFLIKKLELWAEEILDERKEVPLSIVNDRKFKVINKSNPRVLDLNEHTSKAKKVKMPMVAQEFIEHMYADGFYSAQDKLIVEAILEKYERES